MEVNFTVITGQLFHRFEGIRSRHTGGMENSVQGTIPLYCLLHNFLKLRAISNVSLSKHHLPALLLNRLQAANFAPDMLISIAPLEHIMPGIPRRERRAANQDNAGLEGF